MKKTALILTLPQGKNYGGMLQAYAVKSTLCSIGYSNVDTSFSGGSAIHSFAKSIPGLTKAVRILRNTPNPADEAIVTQFTSRFINKNISLVDFKLAKKRKYDAYIVGSDQVWRKPYTYVPHNMFSFVKNDAPRISYAASFGKDNLDEYGDKLIAKTKKLAQKFDAISVREDTGVDVAQKYWGVTAEHHVDPTLLLSANDYVNLVKEETLDLAQSDGDLFAYVLDVAVKKQGVIDAVAKTMKLKPFTVIDGDENNGRPMPPVTQWLKSFMDAKYVVTDSFHGTVFSIIFNKPFIAIGNKDRGLARFQSLLKIFGLEDRLVESVDDVTDALIKRPIDWGVVNKKIASEQRRSMDYLRKHLG